MYPVDGVSSHQESINLGLSGLTLWQERPSNLRVGEMMFG